MEHIIRIFWNLKEAIAIQSVLAILIYLLVRYRFRNPSNDLVLKKSTIKKLIENYKPEPLIENYLVEALEQPCVKYNFASYDIFNMRSKFKNEIRQTIQKYGIGTCGPRGFYGTLDIHLALEEKICSIFQKESCIIYSNHYACVQSVISCFCKLKNTIYFHEESSEAIIRGIKASKSSTIVFSTLENLESKLSREIEDKYLVVERISKNTGQMLDLQRIIELKYKYGFRIILDESYSVPFLYQNINEQIELPHGSSKGSSRLAKKYSELYKDVDVIVGSLCHGYPTNGGFSCGSLYVTEYQRLNGASYIFSASLPAFLVKAGLCCISEPIDYEKIKKVKKMARECIKNIVSDESWPIILVKTANAEDTKRKLRQKGYAVGINGEYVRVCFNENTSKEEILAFSVQINNLS
jgi:serine palmitoyltransferase